LIEAKKNKSKGQWLWAHNSAYLVLPRRASHRAVQERKKNTIFGDFANFFENIGVLLQNQFTDPFFLPIWP
jgi:hypothetical protein